MDGPEDVIEQGGGRRLPALTWRPSRGMVLLTVAALLVGLAAGYVAGDSRSGSRAKPSTVPVAMTTPALAQSIGGCSAQVGHELQLGVQVTNQSGTALVLHSVQAELPLGGLRAVSVQWGPCGVFPQAQQPPGSRLAPGASIWFTVTFQVLMPCPQPLPVQFAVGYEARGRRASTHLPGFPDLGQAGYSGCNAH